MNGDVDELTATPEPVESDAVELRVFGELILALGGIPVPERK